MQVCKYTSMQVILTPRCKLRKCKMCIKSNGYCVNAQLFKQVLNEISIKTSEVKITNVGILSTERNEYTRSTNIATTTTVLTLTSKIIPRLFLTKPQQISATIGFGSTKQNANLTTRNKQIANLTKEPRERLKVTKQFSTPATDFFQVSATSYKLRKYAAFTYIQQVMR